MADRIDGPGTPGTTEPSVGELFGELSEQTSRLVCDEVKLAKTELQDTVKHTGIGVGLFGGAGLFGFLGLVVLIAAAVLGLALVLPEWLAALIVAAILFAIAAIAALLGKKQVSSAAPPAPERAIENVKKDIAEVKEHPSHD